MSTNKLPAITPMNELFNKVAYHLLSQNKRSMANKCAYYNEEKMCAYRGDNGLKCAIGFLIKDEFYYPNLEGTGIGDSCTSRAVEESIGRKLSCEDKELLTNLQVLHDQGPVKLWRDWLNEIAKKYGFIGVSHGL